MKGAWSSATDSTAPLPEGGASSEQVYRNAYFNLEYSFGAEWAASFAGPPPSDSGYYVLAQLEPKKMRGESSAGHLMIAAQDLFFAASPATNAFQLMEFYRKNLSAEYTVERKPTAVHIAGHDFIGLDYSSPVAGLHWHVLATEIRCHVVQFVFTGRTGMQRFLESVKTLQLADGEIPVCVKDFATAISATVKLPQWRPALSSDGRRAAESRPPSNPISAVSQGRHLHASCVPV